MRSSRKFLSGGVLAVTCLLAAACGSSSSNGGTTSTTSAATTTTSAATTTQTSSGSAAGLAAARALYTAGLKTSAIFPSPTGKVTPGSHEIAVVSVGQATVGASTTSALVQQAIKAIGWTAPPTYDGKFSPVTASGLIEQAVNAGVQGLVLVSITPSTVASAVNLAASKNIPIVCILCGPSPSEGVNANIINDEPSPVDTGDLQAAYPIVTSNGGKTGVLIYADNQFAFTALQIQTAVNYLKTNCPACTVIERQMVDTDFDIPGIPVLASVLDQYPKGSIGYLIAPYDSAAQPFLQLMTTLGRTEIKTIGYSATANYASLVCASSPPGAAADITIPLPYMGWAAVDELARALAHQPTWNASQMPVGLLTKANCSEYPTDSTFLAPVGNFRTMFEGLWGK
jgi:ribose transport system substrate-binding protein